ncbi:MAG: hypothetical protein HC806_02690, partial [Anaerolineae bacterium]|nr:hypothetical protein [Anaerolineae bacterium]
MSILVIGGVTLDILHLPNFSGPVTAPGGAGMYTALAGKCAGAPITLFAQRPEPLPDLLQPIAASLHWIGPTILASDLPWLEIAHYGGGKAALLNAHWGAQANDHASIASQRLVILRPDSPNRDGLPTASIGVPANVPRTKRWADIRRDKRKKTR